MAWETYESTLTSPSIVHEVSTSRAGLGKGKVYPASAAGHLLNPLRFLIQPPSRIVNRVALGPSDLVLELGCGPGWFSRSISSAIPRGHLVLCDVQPAMLRMAVGRIHHVESACAVTADACDLPFVDETFDAIVMSSVLGEVPDRVRCLRELRRVLTDSGSITVVETRRDSDFIPLTEIGDLATQAGLVISRTWGWKWEFTARLTARK